MSPQVTRLQAAYECPDHQQAESIVLALMGVGDFPAGQLSEIASWERSNAPALVGRAAIETARRLQGQPAKITISQITAQGSAGTVTGWLKRNGSDTIAFCHILKFTDRSQCRLAQIVSIEHKDNTYGAF